MRPLLRLFALTLLMSGCAFAPQLEAPQLSVADVQILGGDLFQQKLRVRLHVQNPNDRALPVESLTYTLEVEGQLLASGESAASFTVPPLGEAEFDMNVTTNLAATLFKVLAGNNSRELAYHMKGKVMLSQGFLRSIPFEQKGSFKLD
ncbi:MAG: LEA type 2 family protein [Proteobacteria bacterium]|nr:LEA type 2 family protein [Pseudomonadota bacterium]